MEEKRPTPAKFGLIYGVLAAIIGIVFTSMLLAGDMFFTTSRVKDIIQMVIFIAVVIVAVFNFRKANSGFLSIGQALGIGAITAIVAALITMLFTYLLTTMIVPDFWDRIGEVSRIAMLEQNPSMTPSEVEYALEMQSKFSWIMYPAIFIMNLFIGFITALITGLILKRSENLD